MSPSSLEKRTGTAKAIGRYLSAPYVRMLIPNAEEGGYLAEVLELPGCISEGETPEEAYRNLEEAMGGWIATSLDHNRPIPEPVGAREYSGHFPLRMSSELHRAAALRAMQEGVSLNQWITRAITANVATEDVLGRFADAVAVKVAGRLVVDIAAGVRMQIRDLGPVTFEDSTPEVTPLEFRTQLPEANPPSHDAYTHLLRRLRENVARARQQPEEVKEDA